VVTSFGSEELWDSNLTWSEFAAEVGEFGGSEGFGPSIGPVFNEVNGLIEKGGSLG